MKKSLSLLLAVLMLLSVFSVMQASAAESTLLTSGDFEYTVSNRKATITKYNGTQYNEYVPEKIDNYPVTAIGAGAFANNTNLRTVTLYANVTSIGNGAFTGMRSDFCLKYRGTKTDWDSKVTVGTGNDGFTLYRMRFLYENTFWYAVNTWDNITITASCDMVEDVTIPETIDGYTVTTIAGYSYDDDWTTKTLRLPDTVTNLGYCSIGECSITSLYIGRGLKNISTSAFEYNSHLTDIYYNGTEAEWKKIEIEEGGNERLKEVTMHYVNVFKNVDITGVELPVEGQKASFNYTENEKFSVESFTWYNVTDGYTMTSTMPYEAGSVYRATFKLKVKQGYRFDFSNREASVNGKAASSSSNYSLSTYDYMVVTYEVAATPAVAPVINRVEVTGVVEPVAGESPVYSAVSANEEQYEVIKVYWYDGSKSKYVKADDKFEEGVSYLALIDLRAKDGYEFKTDNNGFVNLTGSVNGVESYQVSGIPDMDRKKYVEVHFTFVGAANSNSQITVIDKIDITGVVEPKAGDEAVFTFTASPSEGFSVEDGVIDWYCTTDSRNLKQGDKFEAGKQYAAYFLMYAADGYQFAVDEGNKTTVKVTVNGKEAENPNLANYDAKKKIRARYTFPKLGSGEPDTQTISEVRVKGFVSPKAGEKAALNLTPAGNFTITDAYWYLCDESLDYPHLSANDAFEAGKEYSIQIYVKADDGYAFGDESKAFFNDETGEYYDHSLFTTDGDSSKYRRIGVIFKASSAEPEPTVISSVDVTDIVMPVAGAHPVCTASVPNNIGSYQIYWNVDGNVLNENDIFEGGKSCTLWVLLNAAEGYKFATTANDNPNVSVTVNGEPALQVHTVSGEKTDECIAARCIIDIPDAPQTPTETPTEKPTEAPVWSDWEIKSPATVDDDGYAVKYDMNNPANSETMAIPKIGEIKYSGWKFTYNGKTQRPSVAVYDSTGKKLTRGVDYTIIYPTKSINAGLYVMSVSFQGKYAGLDDYNYHIQQAKNPMTVKVTTKTVKYSAVKKKAVTVTAISVKKAQGKVTYKKLSGSKYLTVNAKTGKITVKKGTKKGTYKIKVKVSAKGNTNYKSLNKNVTVTIKVK